MASGDLTVDLVYNYLVEKGGKVRNRDAVRYFRTYLTDPALKESNRVRFKDFVNRLAHTRTEDNEKILVLKAKYNNSLNPPISPAPPTPEYSPQHDPRNSLGIPVSPIFSSTDFASPPRQPPPYRPPPPPSYASSSSLETVSLTSLTSMSSANETPQAPPRRRDPERKKSGSDEVTTPKTPTSEEVAMEPQITDKDVTDDKQTVSVKERTQKFNRLASVEDELSPSPRPPKSAEKSKSRSNLHLGAEEEDGASVTPLEPKRCMEWYVTASRGDYQELLRLANSEPRLVKKKTVLHWGAKYGNADIIKIFAGKYNVDVNGKTNGGYTPLHISAQFGHKTIFKLLIEVYKADTRIRDYSGRTAEFYLLAKQQKESTGITLRKIKGRKKQSDKDLGFLRIGSLNVRVKKTTEALGNYFLGGGNAAVNPIDVSEKVHKGWGSADNVNKDNVGASKSYKKKSKRIHESGGSSTPSTPKTSRSLNTQSNINDSDSDSAAGFDSTWKN